MCRSKKKEKGMNLEEELGEEQGDLSLSISLNLSPLSSFSLLLFLVGYSGVENTYFVGVRNGNGGNQR